MVAPQSFCQQHYTAFSSGRTMTTNRRILLVMVPTLLAIAAAAIKQFPTKTTCQFTGLESRKFNSVRLVVACWFECVVCMWSGLVAVSSHLAFSFFFFSLCSQKGRFQSPHHPSNYISSLVMERANLGQVSSPSDDDNMVIGRMATIASLVFCHDCFV